MEQVIKVNKYMLAIICFFVIALFTYQKTDVKTGYRTLITGRWQGKEDTLKVILEFSKNVGSVYYLQLNKKYTFRYIFKNDSIIKLWSNNEKPHFHVIRKLDKMHLQLRPYPIKVREAIDIIDEVDFTKDK